MSMTNPVKNFDTVFKNNTSSHTIVESFNQRLKNAGFTLDDMVPVLGEARWPRNLAEVAKTMSARIG